MPVKPTKALREKARLELNEREDTRNVALVKFRNLVSEVEDLICPIDDEFLIRFLRARKFNLEKALKLLKQYYLMRKNNPKLFKDLTPETLSSALSKQLQIVLRSRDAKGRHIFVFRAGNWNPSEINLDDIFRCNYLCLEEMTSTMETQINGITAIVDFKGFSFYQARQFTPKHAQRMVQILQDSYPCRFQEFHLVNQPYIFDMLFAVVKPFLSEKIRNRIFVHGENLNSLHDTVKPKILPTFLGGKSNWKDDWMDFNKQLIKKNDFYTEMSDYGLHSKSS